MKTALLSVSNKEGIVEFASSLIERGYEILSSGGTEKLLSDSGLRVSNVSRVTGFQECLDGRVKTLHPAIHAGILARRELQSHMNQLKELNYNSIDLVAVNLYPFKETVSRKGATLEEAVENIDIGGPAMLRSAAKNYRDVIVLVDPGDYDRTIEELDSGGPSIETRLRLAAKVFRHTTQYDSLICDYLGEITHEEFPEKLTLTLEKYQDLRYGENPHQRGALYAFPFSSPLGGFVQLQGKELSFNNLIDASAALELLVEFKREFVMIGLKHTNPCGVALGSSPLEAWLRMLECDPISIFGGVIATNMTIDGACAERIGEIFLEILMAPSYTPEALEILEKRKNLRVLKIAEDGTSNDKKLDFKVILGGMAVQDKNGGLFEGSLEIVTSREPAPKELEDLIFAWKVVKHVKSNAIVLARDGQTFGIGPGQTNRIWALENALRQSKKELNGAVVASDAFFPFSDCVEVAAKAGISAIIQPGGSIRDKHSIDAANRAGLSMVFTHTRHFKH